MGQYLSILPALLGWYGVYWTMKRKEPSGWGNALPSADSEDEDEAEEDEEEEEEDEEGASARRRKASDAAPDEDEDDEDDEDDEHPESAEKSAAVDPDVEAEFEAGKLKKVRQEPTE
jgi:hypothetical protein